MQVRYSTETGTFDWEVDEGVEVTEAYWLGVEGLPSRHRDLAKDKEVSAAG